MLSTKLYRKIEFFYTGTMKNEAYSQILLHTSFNCYECPIFKECNKNFKYGQRQNRGWP